MRAWRRDCHCITNGNWDKVCPKSLFFDLAHEGSVSSLFEQYIYGQIYLWTRKMSPRLGLDKLQFLLSTSDVTISPDFPATVENPVNAATGEALAQGVLYRAGDREISGRVAHYNTKMHNLTT